MKEMSKYSLWAEAELKRGAKIQTVTDVKTYKTVIQKVQNDKQQTAIDSQKLVQQMVEAYISVQAAIAQIVNVAKSAKGLVTATNGLMDNANRVIISTATACQDYSTGVAGLITKLKAKKCTDETEIIKLLEGLTVQCKANPNKDGACIKTFKTWFEGTDGKAKLLESFRGVFSTYAAIIGAFKEASGQQ